MIVAAISSIDFVVDGRADENADEDREGTTRPHVCPYDARLR